MLKYFLFLSLIFLPVTVSAANVYVEFGYTGEATSFELYQDAVLFCTEPDSGSRLIICPVVESTGYSSHIYHIVAKSDGADVVGDQATYNQDDIAPTVRSAVMIDAAGKRGRRTFYRTVGENTLPYAPVVGAGGSFSIRTQ